MNIPLTSEMAGIARASSGLKMQWLLWPTLFASWLMRPLTPPMAI
jgi:hypothetical protein